MTAKQQPLLRRGGLTDRVYIVTSYKDLGDGMIEARTKYDVTDQYHKLRVDDADRGLVPTAQLEAMLRLLDGEMTPTATRQIRSVIEQHE